MSGDRGAKALAERIHASCYQSTTQHSSDAHETSAALWLGEHGLFVEDVREHEPVAYDSGLMGCRCGWRRNTGIGEPFFDHIGTQP
jgi:hypothetical protein